MDSMKLRAKTILELSEMAEVFLVSKELKYKEEASKLIGSTDKSFLNEIIASLEHISDLSKVQEALKDFASSKSIKIGELMQPIRAILTGDIHSMSVFEIIQIIGKENTLKRLKNFS